MTRPIDPIQSLASRRRLITRHAEMRAQYRPALAGHRHQGGARAIDRFLLSTAICVIMPRNVRLLKSHEEGSWDMREKRCSGHGLPWVVISHMRSDANCGGNPTGMSTTRNILDACNCFLPPFIKHFGFYLDSLDYIFALQGRIGLEETALGILPDTDQSRFKSYLFLMESVNTTSTGALLLLAGNIYSDVFALLRMIYEAASLMHYGNQSRQRGDEVYRCIFKSGLDEAAHAKGEWALIKKAESCWEAEKPGLIPLRQYINNFGAHVSRAKIVLGNVGVLGTQSASTVFLYNFKKREYLMGLDLLHCLLMMTLEEYDKHAASYPGSCPSVAAEIAVHQRHFISEVRPRLQACQESS